MSNPWYARNQLNQSIYFLLMHSFARGCLFSSHNLPPLPYTVINYGNNYLKIKLYGNVEIDAYYTSFPEQSMHMSSMWK